MFCKQCGKKAEEAETSCSVCGAKLELETTSQPINTTEPQTGSIVGQSTYTGQKKSPWAAIVAAVIIIGISAAIGYFYSIDEEENLQNNEAIESFDQGDSTTAIEQFRQAADSAVKDENKILYLKNLGYVYFSDGSYEEAEKTFREALALTKPETLDYYLILAEIAFLEENPEEALANYTKAYELNPNDYQTNNSLALFFLDLDGWFPDYIDDEKALFHAQKALENDDAGLELTKQNLGIAHYFNSNYSEAIKYLSTTDYARQPAVGYWMGYAYYGKGDYDNAVYYFQLAKDAGVEFPEDINQFLASYEQ